MDNSIPDKLYFKIGEVVSLTGIKAHVLRYWESEFGADIRPVKSSGRQRLYRRQDIELILQLKDLLYRQGFTIAGAKKKLHRKTCDHDSANQASAAELNLQLLQELRSDLIRLRKTLGS
ncbi:MAG: MerR family transcriptional regulator [Desulfuromonadales bacterium C00003068]|jgi:DNA-binding transcriptional MerR regulator|nr:MAG: MerR family transcriptional regulator [Desulfuromonadales bacterium C00003068]